MEISLKTYLDDKFNILNERFEVVHRKLDNLETLRQDEHDVVVALTKEIQYRTEEIDGVKRNADACKAECMRRKDDFDDRVVSIVEPMIVEKTSKLWITLITGLVIFLAGVAGYLIDKTFFPEQPERTRVHRAK